MTVPSKSLAALLWTKGPGLLVLVALGAILLWGHRTGWKAPKLAALLGGQSADAPKDDSGDNDADAAPAVKVIRPEKTNTAPDAYASDKTVLRFAAADDIEKVGIETDGAKEQPLAAHINAPGEIGYDQTRVSRLSVPVSGKAWRVDREIGDRVKKDDVLALVESPKVGEAKAEFLQSLAQLHLKMVALKSLQTAGGAVAERQLDEAQAERQAARARMFSSEQALANLGLPLNMKELSQLDEEQMTARIRFLGLPDSVIRTLDPAKTTANLIPVISPRDGVVTERQVELGEVVDSTKSLFVVADLSRVWITMDVGQEDSHGVALDQAVTFLPDGHPGEELKGKVTWMSTTVDEKTRTMPVRAAVDNPGEHFRAHTFGTARITTRDQPDALMVPSEAVQRDGRFYFVFVKVADNDFQVRQVQYGMRGSKHTEVRAGLRPGEQVVTKGSHVLKSELLRGQLGDND
jgi:cobalt-zinc-cadmium efflux system membrane fusion protein